MLIIKTDQPNTLVVTVSQNSELTNPEYLFSFTHIFSKEQVNFIPTDISTHKSRYDEFYFVEGSGVGEINFPYQGQYLYVIYEQPSGSGNLNPSLATNVVENGDAQIFPSSASTMDSAYDIYISTNEDNSNIIFAPDEPNPTPNVSPSPSNTPGLATPTPTPSVTQTNTPTPSVTQTNTPTITPTQTTTPTITPTNTLTPTPSSTPPPISPLTYGALWWIDFTDVSTIITAFGLVITATDKISSVVFSVPSGGPIYNPTGYLGVSATTRTNASQLSNPLGTYTGFTEYSWFGRVYDDVVSQRGGKILVASDTAQFPSGSPFLVVADFNINPYPPGPVWTFQADTDIGGPATLNENFTFSAWTNIALRYYKSGSKVRFEFWENGVEISHTEVASTDPFNVTNPVFGLMFDGGIDFNTEQFFFDRKLTNTEMVDMFTYLTNKY